VMCPWFRAVGLLGLVMRRMVVVGGFILDRGEHPDRGVAALSVVEDLEVLESLRNPCPGQLVNELMLAPAKSMPTR